ncbi:hydrogenase [Geothrix limicola]|uniref:Hydrogenase n=1 Tax=Geothrix limicola TaxID=2927978 RepID=A0ABQ5QJ89_9BACT|nr:NADH-quinone oxidoreductase subunit H [Geothrix limicola]GLH74398.1 hydrogenase [Geothrix limicola]
MSQPLLSTALNLLLHALAVLLLPPLIPGLIAKVKARMAGRTGPPVLQLYYDLAKLSRKEAVFSRTTTWIFLAGPVGTVAAVLVASLMVPFGHTPAPISFEGDVILFAYLLGLARFLTVLSALDTGSAFEGMGAAREVTFSALAEPALFFGFAALAKATGSLSLAPMLVGHGLTPQAQGMGTAAHLSGPLILILAGWSIVYLAENARIPVDDPNTHLELTMIHEVMVLDHSGRPFALVLYGASLKLVVLGALLVDLLLPRLAHGWMNWLMFLAGLGGLALAVGLVESMTARFRMTKVPQFLLAGVLASAFAFLLLLV